MRLHRLTGSSNPNNPQTRSNRPANFAELAHTKTAEEWALEREVSAQTVRSWAKRCGVSCKPMPNGAITEKCASDFLAVPEFGTPGRLVCRGVQGAMPDEHSYWERKGLEMLGEE